MLLKGFEPAIHAQKTVTGSGRSIRTSFPLRSKTDYALGSILTLTQSPSNGKEKQHLLESAMRHEWCVPNSSAPASNVVHRDALVSSSASYSGGRCTGFAINTDRHHSSYNTTLQQL
jgi:hypothetical protein